jgi:hypothetical protein
MEIFTTPLDSPSTSTCFVFFQERVVFKSHSRIDQVFQPGKKYERDAPSFQDPKAAKNFSYVCKDQVEIEIIRKWVSKRSWKRQ